MAIFRVMYYRNINVGSGGRITIPQEMRDDLRISDGDALTVRLEESEGGQRQFTVWRAESNPNLQV
ncbi:AbrB/MazE/SpoVT family DNA-binding domain-containing protein [Candidatus Palauibacter sp.]|uniref:AbrB/MazE/SpoVT family DNA-binding domain-containing protein n=1 Tax=Candidatus Palauibacter sp. TaxID=3101350 RepID=UPI003C6EB492